MTIIWSTTTKLEMRYKILWPEQILLNTARTGGKEKCMKGFHGETWNTSLKLTSITPTSTVLMIPKHILNLSHRLSNNTPITIVPILPIPKIIIKYLQYCTNKPFNYKKCANSIKSNTRHKHQHHHTTNLYIFGVTYKTKNHHINKKDVTNAWTPISHILPKSFIKIPKHINFTNIYLTNTYRKMLLLSATE